MMLLDTEPVKALIGLFLSDQLDHHGSWQFQQLFDFRRSWLPQLRLAGR